MPISAKTFRRIRRKIRDKVILKDKLFTRTPKPLLHKPSYLKNYIFKKNSSLILVLDIIVTFDDTIITVIVMISQFVIVIVNLAQWKESYRVATKGKIASL